MDKNYDAEEFAQFLNDKKPGLGIDVKHYTIAELYDYVYEFQTRVWE